MLCLAVTPLLRELIVRAVQGPQHAENPLIQQLMLQELASLENLALHIPMPEDRRLQSICLALLQKPDHLNTLEDWAQQVGASSRTLARLFQQQLKMTFNDWRQQLRLMEALPRLLAGKACRAWRRTWVTAAPARSARCSVVCWEKIPGNT